MSVNAMVYALALVLFALIAAASILQARSNRQRSADRATLDEHAQLARMYARRADTYRQRSQRQQQVDRFLADYYRIRAARMQILEAEHRQRSF